MSRRPLLRSLGILIAVWPAFVLPGTSAPALRFTEHLIADRYGYTFGVAAHDLDGDGDLDLTNVDIVGKSPSAASLLWFENDGRGTFQRHVIHENENGWLERHSVGDINGDGRPDVAVVSNRDGLLLWFAHPGEALRQPWKRRVISRTCPNAYDVVLVDVDADGDLDAASAGYVSQTLAWYENPGPAGWDEDWPRHVIDATLTENRTVRVGDFNRDGRPDLLAASVGASFTAAGESASPAEHGGAVAWFENPGEDVRGRWRRHPIDEAARGAIHGHPVDLDGDGDLDVALAFGMRPEHIPTDRHAVVWYENLGDAGSWKRHVVGPLPCAFEVIATDLDRDGDLDLAATAWAKGDQVVWFENTGNPRTGWELHVLREKYFAANQVIAADLDGDGFPDLIATADDGSRRVTGSNELRWWRNAGTGRK